MSVLVILFGIWGLNSLVDERVDKRLRASGVVVPTPPKPKSKWSSVFLSPRLALIGAAFGVIGLLAVIGGFVV